MFTHLTNDFDAIEAAHSLATAAAAHLADLAGNERTPALDEVRMQMAAIAELLGAGGRGASDVLATTPIPPAPTTAG